MPTSKFDNFMEKHFDNRKLASPPKPPTPHHHHRIDPKEAEHPKHEHLIKAVSKFIKLVKAEDEYSFDTHWMDRAHLPGGPLEPEDVEKLKRENAQYADNLKNGRSMPYTQHAYHHNNAAILHNHASDLEFPQDAHPRRFAGSDRIEFPSDGPNKVRLGHSYDIDSLEDMDKKHGDIDISTFHKLIKHPYRFARGGSHPAKGSVSRTEPFKIGTDISTPGAMLHNTLNNRFDALWNVNNESDKKPPLSEGQFKAIQNMFLRILKEGDGGAAIDGLSGVVFTSENAGIFTPAHGGHHTTAKKRKQIKRDGDKKRKKLLGKQKKNGIDRLEQFIREGSPIKKAPQELPLQRIKNMSGRAGTEYTPTHQSGDRKQLNYKKEGEKRTVGEENQPNSSLSGLNSSLEMGRQATTPQNEDPSVSLQKVPAKQAWDKNNVVINKYSPGSVTSLGVEPDQNPQSEPPKYIERSASKSGQKTKQQDVQMNDVTKKVKKLSDEDADVEQPAGAVSMAVREVNKQLAPWGSGGSIDRDELKRGGDLDELEDGEEEEPTESELVINAIKRLQERKQKHLDKGADDALFLAMMEDIDAG